MRSNKAFARTKEEIATTGLCDAVGGAQVAEVYQIARGRNLDAAEAHRIVAQVSLGKHSILFRLGNDARERKGALDELTAMLRGAKTKRGEMRFPFNMRISRCIAGVALNELAIDMCFDCKGAGVVPDHDIAGLEGRQPMKVCPACMGAKRRRYGEDERVLSLAKEWCAQHGGAPEDATVIAETFRSERRMEEMVSAINYAKGELITCERVATEETAKMLERL